MNDEQVMIRQLQRVRTNSIIRDMLSEITFDVRNLIQPLFIVEGLDQEQPISGLRGNSRLTLNDALKTIESDLNSGVRNFLIFLVPSKKNNSSFNKKFIEETIGSIKSRFDKEIYLWLDVCLCSFTDNGHCCIFNQAGEINPEATMSMLTALGTAYANAGADGIAPSDMNDNRVGHLRTALNHSGHTMTPIMSYSTKFAGSFYGPFRNAAECAPKSGDRRQYQIDIRNRSDAILSSIRCAEEGADMLLIKPGMPSLDLITPIAQATNLAVGTYQVSSEYAGITLLAQNNFGKFEDMYRESLQILRRAGSRYIVSYGARFAREIGF